MSTSFCFRIEGEWNLGVKEIWPDGDAPENPTVADVMKVVDRGMPLYRLMSAWSLQPTTLTIDGEVVA